MADLEERVQDIKSLQGWENWTTQQRKEAIAMAQAQTSEKPKGQLRRQILYISESPIELMVI